MEHVKVDQLEDGIARVLVSRGDIGNASSPEMLGEIRDAFASLSADRDVRAIVVAGSGKNFSYGLDLMAMGGTLSSVLADGATVGVDRDRDLARGYTVTDSGITVVGKGIHVER